MAKKKVTHHHRHQPKGSREEAEPTHPHKEEAFHVTPEHEPMDQEPAEKLQSLKSLNSLLLKETFDRRQQVESLEQAKVALEAELTRFGEEKRALEAELTRACHQNVEMELELAVVSVFQQAQMDHMATEFGKLENERGAEVLGLKREVGELTAYLEKERVILGEVSREKDLANSECGSWIEKVKGMRDNLEETERARGLLKEELKKLEVEHERMVRKYHEGEKANERVRREKESMESDLAQATEEIGQLKRKIEALAIEKKDVKVERSKQDVKIDELEKEVGELKGLAVRLQREEQRLQQEVLELEKRCYDVKEREKDTVREMEAFDRDKKEKEAMIEALKGEKDLLEKLLKKAEEKLEDKERMMEEIIRKKIEMEEENNGKQIEIAGLNKEVAELRNTILALKLSYGDEREKNEALLSEVDSQKEVLERIFLERDSALKDLDDEREIVKRLTSKVVELDRKIGETLGDLSKIMGEHEKLMMQKNAIEQEYGILRSEKETVEKILLESRQTAEELRANIEWADIKSERALTLLTNTAYLLSKGQSVDVLKVEEDIQPYARELELIRNAFQLKESVVEDLNRKLEFLQDSVAEAQKKKGFWTLFSTASTLFGAALVAYLARARRV